MFYIKYFSFNNFFHRLIDENQKKYIDTLKEAVGIQSVSAWPEKRGEIDRMVKWTEDKLKALGAETQLADIGEEDLANGGKIPLPKVLLGTLGTVSQFVYTKKKIIKINSICIIFLHFIIYRILKRRPLSFMVT